MEELFVCNGPCKQHLPRSAFGEFYQKGRMYKQGRCTDCRNNIPADYKSCAALYKRTFPKDNQVRNWRIMAERLRKRGFSFNAVSQAKWDEKLNIVPHNGGIDCDIV